jgi:hypothetical protein
MKAAKRLYHKASYVYKNNALSKQPPISASDGSSTRFLAHHPLTSSATHVILLSIQEAGGVVYTPTTPLFTPPPTNRSLYRNVRKRTHLFTGRWRRAILLQADSWYTGISPTKKIIPQASRSLATYYGQRETASPWLFCCVARELIHRSDSPLYISPQACVQVTVRIPALSRPVSLSSFSNATSNSTRRQSQMFPQQATTSTANNHSSSLIERVLHLRRQLGIDLSLSVHDSEEPHTSATYERRDWLAWSQSPSEGNLPEKDLEECLRCQ